MNNNIVLNRAFSKKSFADLLENENGIIYSSIIKRYLDDSKFEKNADAISEIYNVLLKSYRNEYIYKNTLLNKLLLGRHSLKTTTALTEVPINKSKADFILINGRATVYEIKTELDSLERLDSQLNDYYKAFTNVCVISSESYLEKLQAILKDTKVGICVLTKRNTISERKPIVEDISKLNHTVLFKILRKNEYEEILKEQFSILPTVSQVKYYRECLELFKKIDLDTAYSLFLKALKKRNKIIIEEFENVVPKELTSLIYFSDFKEPDYSVLDEFLNKTYRGL